MSLIIGAGIRKSWGDTDSVTQPGADDATERSRRQDLYTEWERLGAAIEEG